MSVSLVDLYEWHRIQVEKHKGHVEELLMLISHDGREEITEREHQLYLIRRYTQLKEQAAADVKFYHDLLMEELKKS